MIVMKFGGTSVMDAAAMTRVINIVSGKLREKPVVVVSACAKVTDALYKILELSAKGKADAALEMAESLRQRHLGIVNDHIALIGEAAAAAKDDVYAKVNAICDRITGCVKENAGHDVADCTKALIISSGEYLSSTIIAFAMNARGIRTSWIDARRMMITSSDNLVKSAPLTDEMAECTAAVIAEEYEEMDAIITQGFIGATPEGEPTLLGRGGSDYSAALFGMAIDADRIEIWTDVDGVCTADPRIVPNAKKLDKISYQEAAEMARYGAKVLHPLTLEPAQSKNIPLYVLNSMNPEGEGTVVLNQSCIFDGVKSIAYNENIRVINIYSMKMIKNAGFMTKVFNVFSDKGVSVDMISSSEASVSVTVEASVNIDSVIEELRKFVEVNVDRDKAQVSVIGKNIIGVRGVFSTAFDACSDNKIYMISQGSSFLNLSMVIDRPVMKDVVRKLHKNFFENESSH